MPVGGNDGQPIFLQIEVNSVHDGAQFVLPRGENRTHDAIEQHRRLHLYACRISSQFLVTGIFFGRLSREVVHAVLVSYLHSHSLQVDVEVQWLVGQFASCIENGTTRHGKAAVAVAFVQFQRSLHRRFAVASGKCQHAVNHFKKKVIENRRRRFRA